VSEKEQTEVVARAGGQWWKSFNQCESSYNQIGASVHEAIGISVVVPSYNHGRFIDAAIRSLLDQEYPNLEIIVVDGGSMDDTVERLRAYGDRISWNQRTGSGSVRCDY
jgi:cellulose synthase/poly-beta-1,6-N-acetylglucosamine synthase-like glycosyltransferase